MPLDEVTRAQLKAFVARKTEEEYVKSTIRLMTFVISSVYEYANEDEMVSINPATKMGKRYPKRTKAKKEKNPFSRDEMDLFLDTVEAESSSHHPMYLTLGRTGIKIGEALALDGSNVDFNGEFLHIQKTYRGGRSGPAKNGKPRKVDLQPVSR